jgi:ElaB/YqjD/DUF883 family membrane-anchored ribosome-binding protein
MVDTSARKMADDVTEIVKDALGRAADDASHYSERARRAFGKSAHVATDLLGDFADEARARGTRATKYAVREVREHPMAAIAIGVALGAALTTLLLSTRK